MPKQDRAIRTRRRILLAAAKVFEERGYQAATITEILKTAGVTKGALYFHFQSKEEVAQGVLNGQDLQLAIPERSCKTQEVVDTVALQAYRMQTDPMVRAGARLTLDQQAIDLDRRGPFTRWSTVMGEMLEQGRQRGELLPHVVPAETAEFLVAAFGGVQSMSQVFNNYRDLDQRISVMLRHVLPSVVLPSVLTAVDFSPGRGAAVFAEVAGPAAHDQDHEHEQEDVVPEQVPAAATA
ncbi:TetR/AcrR family transcriptional regulator [Streptomyces sp. 15-116A]|uniref:ScbR family autoregulator-binding transcription factor n=1 Tax=Streptomyces sp. 15-116A TaxID=2259035 RepID=UPI0021B22B2A|nr:ScbR family autoregulator-binding transcription factor [Streptomyces sp. 15-116A]MCT7352792.1 TetR/AcrR family transcriptional regulator [Streptomyces sp. 15-116A]